MLSGKELILATKPFVKEDRTKSWLHLLSTLLFLLCAESGALFIPNIFLKAVCTLFLSLLMVRMFVIYHDFQHHAILHRSKPANVIMTLYGLLVLVPSSIWKRSHDYHHAHNSKLFSASIGSYPIATKSKFKSMTSGEKRLYLFVRHPLTIIFGYIFMFMIGMCANPFLNAPKRHFDCLIALVLHVAISVGMVLLFGWQVYFMAMLIPFLISSFIGAYLFYAQHNFPAVTFSCNQDWKYDVAALESSSFMLMNPFMRYMTANIGYHHIHHLNSRIPFYRLPEAMAALPELQKVKTTSFKLKEINACFKLKVWDPERNRMVGLKQN